MKFLADVNVESEIIYALRSSGFDVKWVLEYNPFLADKEILEMGYDEKRVLLTNDKDFGELVFKEKRKLYSLVLFRFKQDNLELKIKTFEKFLNNFKHNFENLYIVLTLRKIRIIKIVTNGK